jgi:uncharacterized membrane protein YobD (UPF0266 family)
MKNPYIGIFAAVLKVQRGESKSGWTLPRRKRKSGIYFVFAAALGIVAYLRYMAGDTQTAAILGGIGLLAVFLGFSD